VRSAASRRLAPLRSLSPVFGGRNGSAAQERHVTIGNGARFRNVPWRIALGIPTMALALGLAMDACSGFPLKGGRSTVGWLAGLLASGAMYLFA
jgi:hypothetical protein